MDNRSVSSDVHRSRKIVTLCGSVMFESRFRIANAELTAAGWIVLAPGIFEHALLHKPEYNAEETKEGLDALHLAKIDMSHAIFVVDFLGYVGKSTRGEMDYAYRKGKDIFYWSKGDLQRMGSGLSE